MFLSACSQEGNPEVDRLNDISYAFHYRDLDSTDAYARKAYALAANYNGGKAEALNNMAFASMGRMDYTTAQKQLDEASTHTDNNIELLIAEVQQMRLCQRMSRNKDFYDYRERADRCRRRINEERDKLPERQKRRLDYAETEYAIVNSTYYYYVGLERQSANALDDMASSSAIRNDTAQYLNYIYNVGAGGIITQGSQEDIYRQEFALLLKCFVMAKEGGYTFFVANSLEAMAEHLLIHKQGETLTSAFRTSLQTIAPGVNDSLMAGWMAENSLYLFKTYGDVYQTAGAERTLASCYTAIGDYRSALAHLEQALSDARTEQAPDLVASIREQLSVAYSAINDKVASDYNRNIYLDLQEETRQDRSLEARADALDHTETLLNTMITVILLAIVLLLFFLWLFARLNKQRQKRHGTDTLLAPLRQWEQANRQHKAELRRKSDEMDDLCAQNELQRQANERGNVDRRAKVSLASGILPLIDRMRHETERLAAHGEDEAAREERRQYIMQLAAKIDEYNSVLTEWIQMSTGQLSLHIETFALAPLFAMVAKSETSFRMKGIKLTVGDTDAVVKADKVLTLFMLNTLADNARKFTPQGGSVDIAAKKHDNYVEISVSDNGCGMTSEELNAVFERKIYKGHGFGLMNCRGIIEKYRKTSRLFGVCSIGAESEKGCGSRFFFRLPAGVVRMIVAIVMCALPMLSQTQTMADTMGQNTNAKVFQTAKAKEYADCAARFADSAYFSNIAGTYSKTVQFTDSCLKYLNLQYLTAHPDSRILLHKRGNTALTPPEIKWFHDSVRVDFSVILDIRNETAVAALALHDLPLYEYNNKVYTQLFKERSADNTLADYCRVMQQSQTNKTIAIMMFLLVLLLIFPAYYFLYYRHLLYYRFCMERIDKINGILLGDLPQTEKRSQIVKISTEEFQGELQNVVRRIMQTVDKEAEDDRMMAESIEEKECRQHQLEFESNRYYVNNAVLDNCLSTLKHETLYYPSRINQLAAEGDKSVEDMKETVRYYHDIYNTLCEQAATQSQTVRMKLESIKASELCANADGGLAVIGNRQRLDYLLRTLRRQLQNATVEESCAVLDTDKRYVSLTLKATYGSGQKPPSPEDMFTPKTENIPYIICRQIMRDHSEATSMRGCGMEATANEHTLTIRIVLPGRKQDIHNGKVQSDNS